MDVLKINDDDDDDDDVPSQSWTLPTTLYIDCSTHMAYCIIIIIIHLELDGKHIHTSSKNH